MDRRDVVFIVGDAFELFSANEGVTTFSNLIKDIADNNFSNICNKIFAPGQGVHREQQEYLIELFEKQSVFERLNSQLLHIAPDKAGSQETHKRKSKNIMISQVRAIHDSLFEADLVLDDRDELLDDHITGQHLPGMVLIEAARQIAYVVTEQFFMEPAGRMQRYFVLHELNTTFQSFAFPVDVTIRCKILDKKLENPAKLFFAVLINFLQADRCVAEVKTTFTVSDNDRLTSFEGTLARRVIQRARTSVLDEAEHQEAGE